MIHDELKITDGAAAGAWIEPRLGGEFGAVALQVPKGFEAYARVFHPASDSAGNPVKWAEVAKACGTIPHREMQWHAILGFRSPDELRGSYPSNLQRSEWAGSDPPTGAMDIETLDALCEILTAHTTDSTHCFFGLCTIEGWLDSFPADQLLPLLQLPDGRDHVVLTGSLSAVEQITYNWSQPGSMRVIFVAREGEGSLRESEPSELQRQAPQLIWPADRTWLVASEVDFDSTLVGGSAELVEAIVKSPELEAWPVGPTDSLAADADKVNVTKRN